MYRITVPLNDRELQALVNLAETEKRHPRDQAAYMIRAALVECGILRDDNRDQAVSRLPQTACVPAITS